MCFFSGNNASNTIKKIIEEDLQRSKLFDNTLYNNVGSKADEYADTWEKEYLAGPSTILAGLCYSFVHSSLSLVKAVFHLLEEESSFLDCGIELLKAVGYLIGGIPIMLLGILGTLANICRVVGTGIISLLNGVANASSASVEDEDSTSYDIGSENLRTNTGKEEIELKDFSNNDDPTSGNFSGDPSDGYQPR